MKAYSEEYLNDVVENQGKLFDLVSQQYPCLLYTSDAADDS